MPSKAAASSNAEIGTAPQYLSYILNGTRSGGKYLPAIVAALKLDPKAVERAIVVKVGLYIPGRRLCSLVYDDIPPIYLLRGPVCFACLGA